MANAEIKKNNKFNAVFWLCFVLAIASLSKFFGGHRYLTQENDFAIKVFIPLSILVFILSMTVMAFIVYAEEKKRNNLKVEVAFFDTVYDLLKRGKK